MFPEICQNYAHVHLSTFRENITYFIDTEISIQQGIDHLVSNQYGDTKTVISTLRLANLQPL